MLKPNQFLHNEAWIVFKANEQPFSVADADTVNVFIVMDAWSTYIFMPPLVATSNYPEQAQVEDLFTRVFLEANRWPQRLICEDTMKPGVFDSVAESKGIRVERVPRLSLAEFIEPIVSSMSEQNLI